MKRITKIAGIFLIFILTLSSCKSKNEVARLIPEEAFMVTYWDTESMLKKVSLDEIRATTIFQDYISDSTVPQWVRALMNHPEESGISLDGGLTFFATRDKDGQMGLVAAGHIRNEDEFMKFNEGLSPASTVETKDKFKTLVLREKGVVGWNKDRFVYAVSTDKLSDIDVVEPEDAEGSEQESEVNADDPPAEKDKVEDELFDINNTKSFVEKLMTLKPANSLMKEKSLINILSEKGDVKVWLNNEKAIESQTGMMGFGLLPINSLIKDARSTYNVNFENGEIKFTGRAYFDKEMISLIKKYRGNPLDKKDFARIPSNDIAGVAAFNVKPGIIKELIKKTGMDGLVNVFLAEANLSLDDIVKAFNGQVIFSVSDLRKKNLSDTASLKELENMPLNILFSVGIGDKESFEKVSKVVNSLINSERTDMVSQIARNGRLAISNNKDFLNNYLDAKESGEAGWYGDISGNTLGARVDLERIFNWAADWSKEKNDFLDRNRNFWGVLTINGAEIAGSRTTGTGKLTLKDTKTNSLKQLLHYMDDMYQINKKEEKESSAELDSLLAHPPMDTIGMGNKVSQ